MRSKQLRFFLVSMSLILFHSASLEISRGKDLETDLSGTGDVFLRLHLEAFAEEPEWVGDITHAGDERIFVAQLAGDIRIVQQDGQVLEERFLDIQDRVLHGFGELGLTGLAFHPDYQQNGYFYVVYTDVNRDSIVSRFQVTADPNIADPDSEEILLTLDQPSIIHNVGDLVFGPDGYLYIGVGDGGPNYDPYHNGQNLQTLFGSILRIDVDGPLPYTIPPDNPFVDDPLARHEIYMYGLRNPWRIHFDSLTNDMYFGDVGEQGYEELNYVPAGAPAGQNFGWSCYEGWQILNSTQCSETMTYTFPVFFYMHNVGCAIVSGPVYRGTLYPELQGHVLFIDYCEGTLYGLKQVAPEEWRVGYTTATGMPYMTTFGTDVNGEIYIGRFGNYMYHVQLIPVVLPENNFLPNLP